MKNILSVFFLSLFVLCSYAQTEAGFLKDAKNNFVKVGTPSTDFQWSDFPPDTIIKGFDVTMVNPGDESTPSLADGVQAYWSLEETAGAVAFDSTDNNYDGDLENTPTIMQTGISNYCYDFDYASSEWIDFGTSFLDVGTDDLTVSCWVKTSAGGVGGVIGNYGTAPYWYLRVQPGNYCKGVVDFGGGNIETSSNTTLLNDVWYHIVYRLDRDGDATLHINNVLQTDQDDISSSSAVNLANSNTHAVGRIGNHVATYYHSGLIDEVSVVDRLYSTEEISNLYNTGTGKFWPYGVSGGDTLNMTTLGYDPRGDSVIVLWKYTGWPTDEEDGTVRFAFPMSDSALYNDTNFVWTGRGDTIVYFTAFTGIDDVWTLVPNKDTVFIDSSDIYPPIQDVGIWDTIFSQHFEQHTGTPLHYTVDLQSPDWNSVTWFDSDHRYPGIWPDGWSGNPNIQDSIVIDPLTNSKVLKESFDDDVLAGYGGQGPARGGDSWRMPLTGSPYSELYVTFNVQFHTNIIWNSGGKLGGGVRSVLEHGGVCPPTEGFTLETMFTPYISGISPAGGMMFYTAWKDMICPSPDAYFWNDFQPVGDGLQYDGATGGFYFDTSTPKWYNITIRYVVNTYTGTTPNADGLAEGYINGRLIARWSGISLLSYADRNLGIRELFWRTFWGGGADPPFDFWFLYDDIYVFTYDGSVDVPRGNELSSPGRILNLPGWPKEEE